MVVHSRNTTWNPKKKFTYKLRAIYLLFIAGDMSLAFVCCVHCINGCKVFSLSLSLHFRSLLCFAFDAFISQCFFLFHKFKMELKLRKCKKKCKNTKCIKWNNVVGTYDHNQHQPPRSCSTAFVLVCVRLRQIKLYNICIKWKLLSC